jgi:RNA polymerase sigma-70 factor (ECF subfamily)
MAASEITPISALLVRARDGDQDALNRLFELCRNYVQVIAQAQVESWLRVKVDASDLVQQTLLEGYRDFSHFQGGTHAEWLAWLRRILARNLTDFVRQFRGAKRQIQREAVRCEAPGASSDAGFDPADSAESPSQHLLRRERELLVADAMAQLDPDYREVILLRNLQQLDFEDVARRMNRSRPAVQMLWMRALRKLQQRLSQVQ